MQNTNYNLIQYEENSQPDTEIQRLEEENRRLSQLLNTRLGMPQFSITSHLASETLRVLEENHQHIQKIKNMRVDLIEQDEIIETALNHISALLASCNYEHNPDVFHSALDFHEQFASSEEQSERRRKDITEKIPVINPETV